MARRCCTDSVAMRIIAEDNAETEGRIIPCRWCDGYGRYEGGRWRYPEDDTDAVRHTTMAALITDPVRVARIEDVLKGRKV